MKNATWLLGNWIVLIAMLSAACHAAALPRSTPEQQGVSSPAVLAFTEETSMPRVLRNGRPKDWGVSLSHSGRYAAYSFMIS